MITAVVMTSPIGPTIDTSDRDRLTTSHEVGEAIDWRASLARAIRDPVELLRRLKLPEALLEPAQRAAAEFPLLVPESYLRRMQPGNPHDPLLRQVLPLHEETLTVPGFVPDAVDELSARIAPGLLQKYAGRALLVTTGTCAIHCRYCFRRHYPYEAEPRRAEDWQPAIDQLRADASIQEVILSGGDPLVLSDSRLERLFAELKSIPHLRRIRVHTRLPIVLPERITDRLLRLLTDDAAAVCVLVVHANHPQEIVADCAIALRRLTRAGVSTLNQAVLLQGINNDADVLQELSERLIQVGVLPYYLHQLDRVRGAAHFEIPVAEGRQLIETLRQRLPGYAVPRYVQEIPGAKSKTPL